MACGGGSLVTSAVAFEVIDSRMPGAPVTFEHDPPLLDEPVDAPCARIPPWKRCLPTDGRDHWRCEQPSHATLQLRFIDRRTPTQLVEHGTQVAEISPAAWCELAMAISHELQ